MLNFLAIPGVKAIGGLVLKGLAIIAAAWFVVHWIESRQQQAVDDALSRREAEITATTLRTQLQRTEQALAQERVRIDELTQQLQRHRDAAQQRIAIFNRHNLGELMQAKPEMIERRINTATQEVWYGIEAESREE